MKTRVHGLTSRHAFIKVCNVPGEFLPGQSFNCHDGAILIELLAGLRVHIPLDANTP